MVVIDRVYSELDICIASKQFSAFEKARGFYYPAGLRLTLLGSKNLPKDAKFMYNPQGKFVRLNRITVDERRKMVEWGFEKGLIEKKTYCTVSTSLSVNGKFSHCFDTLEQAEAFKGQHRDSKIMESYDTVSTLALEYAVGSNEVKYYGEQARNILMLYYIESFYACDGVWFDYVTPSYGILFNKRSAAWSVLDNLSRYALFKMKKAEVQLTQIDRSFERRKKRLAGISSPTRKGDTGFFLDKNKNGTIVIVGCGQIAFCGNGTFAHYTLQDSTLTELVYMLERNGTEELVRVMKSQFLRTKKTI